MSGFPRVTLVHTAANATTSTTTVVAANDDRSYLMLHNVSDAVVFIKLSGAAVLNEGVSLAVGGTFIMSARLGNLDVRAVTAIHAGVGNKLLLITEG